MKLTSPLPLGRGDFSAMPTFPTASEMRSTLKQHFDPGSPVFAHKALFAARGRRGRGARGPVGPLPRERLELALRSVQATSRPIARATPLLRPSPPDPCARSYQSEDLGRRVKGLFDPGRQAGEGALVARVMCSTATDRRFGAQMLLRRTSCRPSPGAARRVGRSRRRSRLSESG